MEETAALGEDQEGDSAVGRGGAARRCRALYARAEVEEEDCRIWGRVVLPIRGMRRRRAVEAIWGDCQWQWQLRKECMGIRLLPPLHGDVGEVVGGRGEKEAGSGEGRI